MRVSEVVGAIKPFVVGWIANMGGGTGPYAPSPHALSSAHHTGQLDHGVALTGLGDDDHTQYLHISSAAGDGLGIVGRVLQVNVGNGLEVSGDAVGVDLASPSGLDFSSGDLQIADSVAGDGLSIASKVLAVDASVVRTTRQVIAGSGLTGGGALSADVTLNVGAGDGISVAADTVAVNSTVVRTTRQVIAGSGLTGGGALSADVTLNVGAGDGISVAADTVAVNSTVVRTTRQVIAGSGLTGGGVLSADVTLNVGAGAGISVAADTIAVNVGANFTWTGTHTFQSDIQANCNLDFLGPRSITTTTGNLTLNPALFCVIEKTTSMSVDCTIAGDLCVGGGIYAGLTGTYPDTGDVCYTSDLRPIRATVAYTGYAFVPLAAPLTSTSWDGDAFSDVTTSTQLDLSAVFGAPAGIRAVLIRMIARDAVAWGTSDLYFACGPSSTEWTAAGVRPAGGDVLIENTAVVPCDGNGDVWYRINASGAGTMDVWLEVWGYWL